MLLLIEENENYTIIAFDELSTGYSDFINFVFSDELYDRFINFLLMKQDENKVWFCDFKKYGQRPAIIADSWPQEPHGLEVALAPDLQSPIATLMHHQDNQNTSGLC